MIIGGTQIFFFYAYVNFLGFLVNNSSGSYIFVGVLVSLDLEIGSL